MPMREKCAQFARDLQDTVTRELENVDGRRFARDPWEREGGGGGRSHVIEDGNLFEKGGVNFSEVFGVLSEEFAKQLPGTGREFYATGVSLVLHPRSPMIPTLHANLRYVEKGDRKWFGGGTDLTPWYLFEEDAKHFHAVLKQVCDLHDANHYPKFKSWCDEYFFLEHRGEARGVGGIFFDYLEEDLDETYGFWCDVGNSILDAYLPIVRRRRSEEYGEPQRRFQLFRRGRYVEFNLIYDRGTVFGLRTKGRVESILMSLPPVVRFPYQFQVQPDSREEELLEVLKRPRDWV